MDASTLADATYEHLCVYRLPLVMLSLTGDATNEQEHLLKAIDVELDRREMAMWKREVVSIERVHD